MTKTEFARLFYTKFPPSLKRSVSCKVPLKLDKLALQQGVCKDLAMLELRTYNIDPMTFDWICLDKISLKDSTSNDIIAGNGRIRSHYMLTYV